MTADDDRIEMVCADCGKSFMALGEWQIRCRTCYARFKDGLPPLATLAGLQTENAKLRAELAAVRAELTALRTELTALRTELARARQRKTRAAPPIPRDQWRRLMLLVHPDKHGGSEAATRAAQWLNEVRP